MFLIKLIMEFKFDNMNNTEQPQDPNSEENEYLENEVVDEIPEIKAWRESKLSDEEKVKIIKARKDKIDDMAGVDKFNFDMTKSVEDVQKELKEKYEAYAGMQKDLDAVDKASLDNDAKEGLGEMKNILASVCGIYEKQLHIEYLQYMEKFKDPNSLLDSYAKRNLLMDKWETFIEGMRADLNKTGIEEEDTMRAWAKWVKDHPKASLAILLALLAAGATAAVLLAPEGTGGALAVPTIKMGTGIVAKMFAGAGSATGAGAGAVAAGGILGKALTWLGKEENRDKVLEGLFGAKIPAIAYLFNGRPSTQSSK